MIPFTFLLLKKSSLVPTYSEEAVAAAVEGYDRWREDFLAAARPAMDATAGRCRLTSD